MKKIFFTFLASLLTLTCNTHPMAGIQCLDNKYPHPLMIKHMITNQALQDRLIHDPELTQNAIKILFPDYQKLIINEKSAQKFIFFRDALNFTNAGAQRIISLPKTIPANVSKHTMEQILTKNKTALTKEDVINCYHAAEFFGADDNVFYRLSEHYLKIVPRAQRGDEFALFKNYLGIKHYYERNYSFERSYKCSEFEIYASRHAYKYNGVIYTLSDLDYLGSALETKGIVLENVQRLSLSDHEISEFNIKKIIALFPNLRSLDLSTNAIRELDLENLSHMPDNFTLTVRDNPLSTIKKSYIKKWPKNCTIIVSKTGSKSLDNQLKQISTMLNISNTYFKDFLFYGVASILSSIISINLDNKSLGSTYLLITNLGFVFKTFRALEKMREAESYDNKIHVS